MSDDKMPMEMDEEYEPDILTLEDETGEEHTFEVLDAADIGEDRYLALVPYSENAVETLEDDAEMLIMRVALDENGEEVLDIVEDEEELMTASGVFLNRLSELYDIDLEDLAAQLRQQEDEE